MTLDSRSRGFSQTSETFGAFISRKRREKGMTLQMMSAQLGIAFSYLSDIEHDRRLPPEERLPRMAAVLGLSGADEAVFYDLAAHSRDAAPADLADYLMCHPSARSAVRYARDNDIDDSTWEEVLDFFQHNDE